MSAFNIQHRVSRSQDATATRMPFTSTPHLLSSHIPITFSFHLFASHSRIYIYIHIRHLLNLLLSSLIRSSISLTLSPAARSGSPVPSLASISPLNVCTHTSTYFLHSAVHHPPLASVVSLSLCLLPSPRLRFLRPYLRAPCSDHTHEARTYALTDVAVLCGFVC